MNPSRFYKEFQAYFLEWAQTQPSIRVIVLTGSQARQINPADEYADLDLELFVTDGLQSDSALMAWLRAYAPVWTILLKTDSDGTCNWLVLYRGGIKVDLSSTPISELERLVAEQRLFDSQQRGYQILLDKDGLAARLSAPHITGPPLYTPPTIQEFETCIDAFFYGAVFIAKQLRRANLWKVKWADTMQQAELLTMLEWHAHATSAMPIDTYSRGDFMQTWVDTQTWHDIHNIFAHFDSEDSWQALLAALYLFTRLAHTTATKLGYPYPANLIHEATIYIQTLRDER